MSSKKVLLSGASGALGKALADGLAKDGSESTRLVRRSPADRCEVQWNPGTPDPFPDGGKLEGFRAAIHLSGASLMGRRWTEEYRREIVSSRIDSTRTLAATLAGLREPPEVLLVASAVGIYGDRGDEMLSEESAPGTGFLADLCRHWEEAARPAMEAGIRVVHMRFGVVLSHDSGALAQMLPVFRLGLGGRLGSGRQWMSWIGVRDLVRASVFVLENQAIKGAVNFVAPEPVTNREFTAALATELHRPAVIPAPAFALRAAFGAMADEALLAGQRVAPEKLMHAGFQFETPQIGEALREILGTKEKPHSPRR